MFFRFLIKKKKPKMDELKTNNKIYTEENFGLNPESKWAKDL